MIDLFNTNIICFFNLKFRFNWKSCIYSGNSSQLQWTTIHKSKQGRVFIAFLIIHITSFWDDLGSILIYSNTVSTDLSLTNTYVSEPYFGVIVLKDSLIPRNEG